MVETDGLGRNFQVGSSVVHALQDVDLRVARGELVAVRGRSGSGKTTLLSLIGGLDRPTAGRVTVDGVAVNEMDQDALVRLRRHKIGFIFQAFGLLSILSAAENVEVPLRLIAADPREREERVAVLLQLVGLGERARHRPHELSGGSSSARHRGPWPTDRPAARGRTHRSADSGPVLDHGLLRRSSTARG
jgi:putative ABC transport system ATP-binding protein